jgi:prepilin-type processing-associated H-X9-DG protein
MDAGKYRMDPPHIVTTASGWGYLPGSGSSGATGYYKDNPPDDWETGRHFDGVNLTFADGHVKWLKSNIVYNEAAACTGCNYNYATPPSSISAWNPYSP